MLTSTQRTRAEKQFRGYGARLCSCSRRMLRNFTTMSTRTRSRATLHAACYVLLRASLSERDVTMASSDVYEKDHSGVVRGFDGAPDAASGDAHGNGDAATLQALSLGTTSFTGPGVWEYAVVFQHVSDHVIRLSTSAFDPCPVFLELSRVRVGDEVAQYVPRPSEAADYAVYKAAVHEEASSIRGLARAMLAVMTPGRGDPGVYLANTLHAAYAAFRRHRSAVSESRSARASIAPPLAGAGAGAGAGAQPSAPFTPPVCGPLVDDRGDRAIFLAERILSALHCVAALAFSLEHIVGLLEPLDEHAAFWKGRVEWPARDLLEAGPAKWWLAARASFDRLSGRGTTHRQPGRRPRHSTGNAATSMAGVAASAVSAASHVLHASPRRPSRADSASSVASVGASAGVEDDVADVPLSPWYEPFNPTPDSLAKVKRIELLRKPLLFRLGITQRSLLAFRAARSDRDTQLAVANAVSTLRVRACVHACMCVYVCVCVCVCGYRWLCGCACLSTALRSRLIAVQHGARRGGTAR